MTTSTASVTMIRYSHTGRCNRWGSDRGARRVSGLSSEDRQLIRAGVEVRITDCPPAKGKSGTTERVVVAKGGRFYARVPKGE